VTSRPHEVELSPGAERVLRKLEKSDRAAAQRVIAALEGLQAEPRTRSATALVGPSGALRLRVGDWRVVYRVEDERLLVLVLQVGHRREIYRDL
jgi:mRNA interferase RelE/StbE